MGSEGHQHALDTWTSGRKAQTYDLDWQDQMQISSSRIINNKILLSKPLIV